MWVKKVHPYDGTDKAGLPEGPVLKVHGFRQHEPIDGPGQGIMYGFADGTWEFPWNVTPVTERGKVL
ncbi:MAG: hypothetical protein ABIE47_06640 [Pseudomonadota bacterium]